MRSRDPTAEDGTTRAPLVEEEKDPAKSGLRTDHGATDLESHGRNPPPSPGRVRDWRLRRSLAPLEAATGKGS